MADSVDRVFSHALNTVNKIRPGSEKPPAAVRLKLYGLYKQAMEGDVEGIMERPTGNTEEEKRAREKWDAWRAQDGISRTEAKRRYITTLITAMHRYASPSPDARELVSELEFVWDQVKSNVPSSTSSSPYGQKVTPNTPPTTSGKPPMRVLSPPPQADVMNVPDAEENDIDDDDDDEDDEFVDAQDSQYQPAPRTPGASRRQSTADQPTTVADRKWRTSVEKALVRMTAEVAALREQLEARRLFRASRRRGFLAWFAWIVRSLVRAAVVDLLLLGAVLLWWKWRGRGSGGKLEKAIWGWLVKVWAKMNRLRLPGMPHTSQG